MSSVSSAASKKRLAALALVDDMVGGEGQRQASILTSMVEHVQVLVVWSQLFNTF